ncbi:hypothetical protein Taro_040125 [Colocasia esculenta]|uniref:Uncharacterized protein n=1 Tax=Colocasia esculenta TaxID=4460 RepID=A0A843WHS7_COLES|nr:hypothetical protein [Colocasia esculenta]
MLNLESSYSGCCLGRRAQFGVVVLQVDTRSGQVDTRPSFQQTSLPDWDSREGRHTPAETQKCEFLCTRGCLGFRRFDLGFRAHAPQSTLWTYGAINTHVPCTPKEREPIHYQKKPFGGQRGFSRSVSISRSCKPSFQEEGQGNQGESLERRLLCKAREQIQLKRLRRRRISDISDAIKVASLRAQLAAAEARAEEAERDLAAWSGELQDALAREADTRAELTEASQELSELRSQVTQQGADLPREAAEAQMRLSLEREDRERERARWVEERDRLTQQLVEACTSFGIAECLRQAVEDQYRSGRERAREQGRGSLFIESLVATSKGSHAPMRPPAPRLAVDPGEAESSRQQRPAEGAGESDHPAEDGCEC